MAFQQGLSGLNAASKNLDVIGHNIANANTVGMKSSRAEFAELIASSAGIAGTTGAGIGVEVQAVSQQFNQGNISITGNSLDVAINGSGFFQITQPDGSTAYSRAGNFKLNAEGELVTNSDAQVMGFPTDPDTMQVTSRTLQAIVLPTAGLIPAKQTTAMVAEFNLDARAPDAAGAPFSAGPPAVAAVPPTPRATYGTSINVYDSQGVAVPVNLYFSKTATADTWDVFDSLDTAAVAITQLVFDTTGKIATPTPGTPIPLTITSPNTNVGTFTVNLDVDDVTQYGQRFAVSDLTQDGYAAGELTSLQIEDSGVVLARYSNGESQAAGKLALINFRNIQGLQPLGSNAWGESFTSGAPVAGEPGIGNFGALRSGSLEDSNVDLTAELVNMITAQRFYQANAQTIKTQDQVLSTLVNLR